MTDGGTDGRTERLERVLADYMTAQDSGERVDRESILRANPDLADDLRAHFEAEARLHRAAEATLPLDAGDATDDRPAPGARFGPYVLQEEIARGGMGVVWRAREERLGRTVALKMILAGHFAGDEVRARFRAEAEAAAHMEHPGIVAIHDVGEMDGRPYFTMNLVEGPSLAEAMDDYRDDPRAAAEVIERTARAVAYGHRRGVLHRDLKPANVLLGPDGPVVTDFGLAKRLEGEDSNLTRTGALMGTPSYMAPEQAGGAKNVEVTTAADVWSLGAILYCLLTGRPPFVGDHPLEVIDKVRSADATPPSRVAEGVPRDLETICLKCLRRDPEARYPTADALADDLRRWLDGRPVSARPVGPVERTVLWARRRPAAATAAGLGLVALLALLVGGVVLGEAIQARKEADLRAAEVQSRRAVDRARIASGAGNPVDAWLWYAEADLLHSNRITRVGTLAHELPVPEAVLRAPGAGIVWRLAYTPDGRRLVGAADGGVLVWSLDEPGPPRVIETPGRVRAVDVSPDGTAVVTGRASGRVVVLDLDSGEELAEMIPPHDDEVNDAHYVADGRVVTASSDGSAAVWRPGGTAVRVGAPDEEASSGQGAHVFSADLHPDGDLLALGLRHRAVLVDMGTLEPVGRPLPHEEAVWRMRWSPEGVRLVTTDDWGLRTWRRDGSVGVVAIPHTRGVGALALSPDGRLALTGAGDGRARLWETRGGGAVGGALHVRGDLYAAAMRPDMGQVAVSGLGGRVHLWPLPSGPPELLRRTPGVSADVLTFSPDGTLSCVFTKNGRLGWYAPDRPRPVRVEVLQGRPLDCRVDGERMLALTSGDTVELWSVPLARDGGPPERLARWSGMATVGHILNAGRVVLHHDDRIVLEHVDGSPPRILAERKEAQRAVSASADGRHVVILRSNRRATLLSGPDLRETGAPSYTDVMPGRAVLAAGGTRLLAKAVDGVSALWLDARTGEILRVFSHGARITALAVSPDGRTVATGGEDLTVRLWDLERDERIGRALTLPLSADGTTGATHVSAITFAPAGDRILVGGTGSGVWEWRVPWLVRDDRPPAAEMAARARLTAERRLDPDGRLVELTDRELDELRARVHVPATGR